MQWRSFDTFPFKHYDWNEESDAIFHVRAGDQTALVRIGHVFEAELFEDDTPPEDIWFAQRRWLLTEPGTPINDRGPKLAFKPLEWAPYSGE